MLQPLEHDLCALSNAALEDAIATLAAHIAAAEYRFLALVASQAALALSPISLHPRWRGERMDASMALGALKTLARRAQHAA